jgi:hypothetical protein
MSVEELLNRASEKGVALSVRDGDRIVIRGREKAIAELQPEITARKQELIEELRFRSLSGHDVILYAQHLLCKGRFLPELAPCSFHCGHPKEVCRRCGASFRRHYFG